MSTLKPLTEAGAHQAVARAKAKTRALGATTVASILDALDATGRLWARDGRYRARALALLERELSFSPEMIAATLDLIPAMLARETLGARIDAELGDRSVLDGFTAQAPGRARLRAVPHGVVLHVAAGNVFLGCIDSLVSALLTKNVSLLKLSSRNQAFPLLFAESLREADPAGVVADKFELVYWKGGDAAVERALKRSVDAILAWGGEAMVRAYRAELPTHVPLIEHGPKISFQVVTREALASVPLDEAGRRIARDVMLWDQAACASPQNLFVERGTDVPTLLRAIGAGLDHALPRGRLDDDEQVELLKERQRAKVSALAEGGGLLEGESWLLHHDPRPGLRPSALNRSLIVKSFDSFDDLAAQLAPYRHVLQSCSYLAQGPAKDRLLEQLAKLGVQRFAPLGTVLDGMLGAPHDGRFGLAELTRLVGDEAPRPELVAFANEAIARVPFYRKLYGGQPIRTLGELKPVTGADLADAPLDDLRAQAPQGGAARADGYVFSSGGTTGKPKFAFFTHAELDRVGAMLARGFRAQGLERGDVCANLFVAGNLWSSFLAVDRALQALGAVQLPIGGMAAADLTLSYLERFKPRAVIGLPSLLAALAQRRTGLAIPIVCYAGEHLNAQTRELLATAWGTQRFFSAGYASVDAGPIGYQCAHVANREHHLFEDQVHLELLDGEAVVTSLAREAMPVLHLRTGDHVEWSPESAAACPCGSRDRKFILHGRCDGQINLWSCRLKLEEIEQGLFDAGVRAPIFQVTVHDDLLDVAIEAAEVRAGAAARSIYEASKDLRATHPLSFFTGGAAARIRVRAVAEGSLPRVARTGKVRSVVDARKL